MYSSTNPKTQPKNFVKTIKIIHVALLAGPILFFIVTNTLIANYKFDVDYSADPLVFLVPALAVTCFGLANFLYKQQLAIAVNQPTLSQKLLRYQTALIIKLALIEGQALFAVVAFLLSGNLFFAAIFALLLLALVISRPTRDSIETNLNLSYEEKTEI